MPFQLAFFPSPLLSVLSSAGLSVEDAVSALLSPAFEVAAEAQKRPYLSAHALRASLEIVKTVLQLVLKGDQPDSDLQRGMFVVVFWESWWSHH